MVVSSNCQFNDASFWTAAIKTYINNGERPAEALGFNSQQILQLRDNNVDGCCCGETSHQGLCEIDCHKAKPEKTQDKLKEKAWNKKSIKKEKEIGQRKIHKKSFCFK